MARDAYEVLGVTRSATDDEIKRAYRQLARECHPDANPDDPTAADRFKEINAAYDAVREPERRRQYDMFGPDAAAGAGAAGNPFAQGGFGLNDLFDAFFSGDVPGADARYLGGVCPDAETVMELTLAEVVTGVRRTGLTCACPSSATRAVVPAVWPARIPPGARTG